MVCEAPGVSEKLRWSTVGTAAPSRELNVTAKVSVAEPALVRVTVSETPAEAAEASRGCRAAATTDEEEPAPPDVPVVRKFTEVGPAVKPAWREPKRSRIPAPANCGGATAPVGYWSNSGE